MHWEGAMWDVEPSRFPPGAEVSLEAENASGLAADLQQLDLRSWDHVTISGAISRQAIPK